MATTSIWAVKGWLGQVVIYAENPEKTANPACYEKEGMTAAQAQGLSDVIDYAAQSRKTGLTDEHAEIMRHFVTGINCQPETARDEMMATKKHYGKDEGVVAYHGYQSFAPGEATPEMAHQIGVRLAQRLWGDGYQVIVATHLDKANHLHNHFVLNNVSMVDGRKYYRSNQDYHNMQKESDSLCREYGLSVIENPGRGKSKHYGEWKAEQDGRQTWRGMVKSDVDAAIRGSMTERQFWDNLCKQGYEIKQGKDISLRPPGKERFVRLCRNFGDDYAIEGIRRRILAQARPERRAISPNPPPKKVRFKGALHKTRRMTGLRALYFYYLYRMGVLPKTREPNPKRVYFLFREDIRFMQNIARETRLLVNYRIDTAEQLTAHKEGLATQFTTLCIQRKRLRYQARSIQDEEKLAAVKSEIAALSMKIGELRREVKLCEDIEMRSAAMRDKIRRAQEDEKTQGKELKKHEPLRGRR
ncbi:Relaxase/Mobilisation nuclease domain [uncultured Eubacteriales bacterium]|uniref:Relaxase/Mobilisation nuclease domain n=1 Tax=uncultured Eubacteriales bacterium TaxID=172733 RepID=A0A212JN18_9FIRM|nr:Relaxase/Mobilisation nuclease domain [uncultured Eubacteriales bacterium]